MGNFRALGKLMELTAIVVACVMAGAALADPPAASIRLGDLTFHYSTSRWEIEPAADGLTATCKARDCEGVSFEMTVRAVPEALCDKETVRLEAERLFPTADRHPVNILAVRRFALVLADSRRGELGAPEAAFGCLTWQGKEYRFVSRDWEQHPNAYTSGFLLSLVYGVTAPPAANAELTVGAMTVTYSTDQWKVFELKPRASVWLECLPPTCQDWGVMVTVTAAPGDAGCLGAEGLDGFAFDFASPADIVEKRQTSVPFVVHEFHSGCRNYTPPHVIACAIEDKVTYRIATLVGGGCHSGAEVPDQAFNELLEGARISP